MRTIFQHPLDWKMVRMADPTKTIAMFFSLTSPCAPLLCVA